VRFTNRRFPPPWSIEPQTAKLPVVDLKPTALPLSPPREGIGTKMEPRGCLADKPDKYLGVFTFVTRLYSAESR